MAFIKCQYTNDYLLTIYGMFYRFGLIDVPDEVKEKMGHPKDRKK